MNFRPRSLAILVALAFLLQGCVATVPVKVASKTAKAGVSVSKAAVKAGAAIIPDSDEKDSED